MKNKLSDWFSMTSAEQKGVILLILAITLLSVIQAIFSFQRPGKPAFQDSTFFRISDLREISGSQDDSIRNTGYDVYPVPDDIPHVLRFDPNTVSEDELRRMGLPRRIVNSWIQYRLHGGIFRNDSDIVKIYGMTPEIYRGLLPQIHIGESYRRTAGRSKPKEFLIGKLDINKSDSAMLTEVRGIGPILSGRIIKYRRLLGGYYSLDQLNEVYGFPDSLVTVVSRFFYADTSALQSININLATEDVMRRHPYIGRYCASGIIKYRKSVQRINNPEELKHNGILSAEQFEKVKKYLGI